MKIIVDMMGGDNAPLAVLEGTAQAVKEYGVQVIGVGSEELVRKTAAEHNIPLDGIELVNCTETIEMCDEPARAIRSKKDSSIVVGLNLLKEGKGDAFVSAGSTGALHVLVEYDLYTVTYGNGICTPYAFQPKITFDLAFNQLPVIGFHLIPATCILYY